MGRGQQVAVPLELRLDQDVYNAIAKQSTAPNHNPPLIIKTWAEWLLTQLARGGMMLQPQHVEEIRNACESPVTEAPQVVRLATRGAGSNKEGLILEVPLDASLKSAIEERAKEAGFTWQEVFVDAYNTMIQNGWLFEIQPGALAEHVNIPKEYADLIRQLLGKAVFFGDEVGELIQKAVDAGALKPVETEVAQEA